MFRCWHFAEIMTTQSRFKVFARAHVSPTGFFAPENVTVKHLGFIGVTGFEPATSWSQTTRSTKLSYTPQ
jgi:hypothetical protein